MYFEKVRMTPTAVLLSVNKIGLVLWISGHHDEHLPSVYGG